MSTPAATARYVIAADDKTGSAVKSVLNGFKEIDEGVKGTVKTMNSVLGVFVGVQLAQGFRKILQATTESTEGQKDFAIALGHVKDAVTDLLAAKSGLPEATAEMENLRDILRDPTLVAAADAVTSTLIKGFAQTAKFVGETVAGLRVLGVQAGLFQPRNGQERIEVNEREITRLEAQLRQLESRRLGRISKGDYVFDPGQTRQQIEAVRAAIQGLRLDNEIIQSMELPQLDIGEISIPDIFTTEDAARIKQAREDELRDFRAGMEIRGKLVEDMKDLTSKALEDLDEDVADSFKEMNDTILNDIDYTLDEFEKSFDKMQTFAEQAARNMQDAFADFLFDPFSNGLKGMLKEFIDIIRRMLAEAAAAKLLEIIFDKWKKRGGGGGGGNKLVDFIGAAVGSVFGGGKAGGGPLQSGKWYIAGERGPEPIWGGGPGAFAMGYGGGQGGGVTVAPVYNIDARGATSDVIAALPAILKQTKEEAVQMAIAGIQRRKYALTR